MNIVASRQYYRCWLHFVQVTSSNYIKAYNKIFLSKLYKPIVANENCEETTVINCIVSTQISVANLTFFCS